jgi:hypothetical protein
MTWQMVGATQVTLEYEQRFMSLWALGLHMSLVQALSSLQGSAMVWLQVRGPTQVSLVQGLLSSHTHSAAATQPTEVLQTGGTHILPVLKPTHEIKGWVQFAMVPEGTHISVVQAFPSSQLTGKVSQPPVVALHVSGRHGLALEQLTGVNIHLYPPGVVASAPHESVVHKLLSLHTIGVPEQTPLVVLQDTGLQGLVVAQGLGANTQAPLVELHESVVQAFPSSHTVGVA